MPHAGFSLSKVQAQMLQKLIARTRDTDPRRFWRLWLRLRLRLRLRLQLRLKLFSGSGSDFGSEQNASAPAAQAPMSHFYLNHNTYFSRI